MKTRLGEFLELSVCLTGFGRLQLLGTGMADEYLRTLDEVLPSGLLDQLLAAYRGLPAAEARDAALAEQILGDPRLGPVARNLMLLWYCGTWRQLPDTWRAANGTSPRDQTHVVSAAAYLSGLQWAVVDAHPAGGRPQGFAAWAVAPEGDER